MSGGVVEYTIDARKELDGLFFWISTETGMNAAEAVMRRIERSIQNLAAFPEIGRVRSDLPGTPRSFSVHPWLLIYEPLNGRRGIRLLRVIDGRRNVLSALERKE